MRISRLIAPVAALSLGLALACAKTESDFVGDYLDSVDTVATEICECDYNNPIYLAFIPLFAYNSTEACYDDIGIDNQKRGCVQGLFADEATDYRAVLDCRARVYNNGAACLGTKTCTDTARLECYQTYREAYNDCPDLPDDVDNQLTDCLID